MHKFIDTMSVVRGLENKLAGMRFTAELVPVGSATVAVGGLMWEVVSKQSTPSLALAVEKALAVTERLACVVPGRERWEAIRGGEAAAQRRVQTFLILLSGVDFDPFAATSFYGDGQVPGLLAMKDAVVRELYGESLGVRGAVVVPRGGESIRFAEGEDEGLSDVREGYVLTVDVGMGVMQGCVSRGTAVRRI